MNELRYCVYVLTNKKNGMMYIGCTCQKPEARWAKGKGYGAGKLKNAIEEFGWDNFKHEVVFDYMDKETALQMEEILIKEFDTVEKGYNTLLTGIKGHERIPDEMKESISSTLLSKYASGEITSGRKGHINSPEMRAKLSKSLKGRSVWNKGIKTGPQSKEANEKRSASLKGHIISAETRKKIGDAQRGPLNHMYGKTSAMGKKCININTGKIYDSLHKCAEGDHINYSDLQRGLKNNHGVYECYRYVDQN